MAGLRVTIASAPFDHRLYHFVLDFSHWEYAHVAKGSESFKALSTDLQNTLWLPRSCPRENRMLHTRNNRVQAHENGYGLILPMCQA
ncbi:hypothetical protein B0O95_1056 [Mycetohabitans endofungorum]|uniref:Uncharacterized protein n=1 Tax=Mycetohabitans endofungorum TaxID=417203 RepID=A0A2P5KB02_9BURK|nr:hypothetical protein B0O95_1056 [Mycetohabitans endofungorum]